MLKGFSRFREVSQGQGVDKHADNALEIVTAHGGGYVSVYNAQGYFEPGWPQRPATNEFRSLSVADLDEDGKMEIVAGLARLNRLNAWVFEPDGSLRPGWPQLSTDQTCSPEPDRAHQEASRRPRRIRVASRPNTRLPGNTQPRA